MCLAQGPQGGDASEARTRGPSVSNQALYHLAPCSPLLPRVKNTEQTMEAPWLTPPIKISEGLFSRESDALNLLV